MADVGFQNGTIRLEQSPAVYYAGQIINGSIVFNLRQPLNFSAIYIQYLGEANVLWSYMEYESINGVKRSREIKYQGHEEYFNYTETLEIAGGNGTTQLSPKRHEMPFKYQLPFTCPSTFKGQKGSIRYTITATLVYPDMRREELRTEFNVVSPLDLNTGNPALKEPINLELEELNPCNWCCSTDAVTVRLQLPVTGYCPGQAIPVSVEVDNNSSVEISKMTFEITTRELYRSGQPPSEHVVPGPTLVSVEKGPVLVGNKCNFTYDMVVPNFIVPYLEHCSIIDLGYFFKVTIVLSGCNDDMQDEAEICLGLVPLKETLTSEYRHPMADSLPPGPIPIPPFHGSHNSVNRSQQNLAPGPYPPYHGSHNSLNRSQNNLNKNMGPVPYPYPGSQNSLNRSQNNLNNPPPYPGNNESYPSEKKDPNIGFRVNPPYPLANVMPGAGVPPYPTSNLMPGASPPAYPAVNSPQGGNLPPYPGGNSTQGGSFPPYPGAPPSGQGFAPSAPPALD